MPEQDKEFQQRLLATFRGEAEEHVHAITLGLIELEKAAAMEDRAPIIERIFREMHSLKGAARSVNVREIETICQSVEGVLARAKRREISLASTDLDEFHAAVKEIERLLKVTAGGSKEKDAPKTGDLAHRQERISSGTATEGNSTPPTQEEAPSRAVTGKTAEEETVRISSNQLDRLLLQVEELVPARWGAALRLTEIGELAHEAARWTRKWTEVLPSAAFLRECMHGDGATFRAGGLEVRKLLEFLEWNDAYCRGIDERLSGLSRSSERGQRLMGTLVDSLLRETKQLLLRPFSSITESLPRVVRDLCRQNGKDAAFTVLGADIEIDRRILQDIKDPLLHLVRNSVDHGIEKPELRTRAGKATQGSITIAIEQKSANKVEILVSDDGAGIDAQSVRAAVVKSGLAGAETMQGMSEHEVLSFIYQSGISTSPIVTDISGRGLGMAIVREKVEKLGGGITLETRPGGGTTFRILLPLTLSTVRGVLVRVGEQQYIIPETFIEQVVLTRAEDIQTVENRATVILGNKAASYVRLRDVLALPPDADGETEIESRPMVVLAVADRRVAFQVDEVVGEQEVMVKGLGPQLARLRNVGGAAVLATGKLVPILNAADLMKTAVTKAAPPSRQSMEGIAPRRLSILVADDSITARTLIKNILEAAGYSVRTAVDGAEALAALRQGTFDLLVSDVDMPRLNGFELTAKIRADKTLAEIPVVLVTALESPRDRERGIDVGASAYIVKSNFEQSNLLEVVRRCT